MDLYQHIQIGTASRWIRGTLTITLGHSWIVLFKTVGLELATRCFIAAIISFACIFIFDSIARFRIIKYD